MIQIPTSALRKAGGRTILQTAADLGVALALIFWFMAFTVILLPRAWPTDVMSGIVAGLMLLFIVALALCQAVVVPALVATILPGTSAGMLLQEHQRRTLGFLVLIPSAVFLLYVSYYILMSWWAAQPAVVEAGLVTHLTLMSLIFFVVVPGWIWSSSSPAAWMAEVEQAHAVKRLRLAHEAELGAMKATFARAIGLMELGLDRLTVEQRQYVGQSINAIHRYRNEQLRQVGRHIGTLMGIDEGLPWQNDGLQQHLDTVLRAVAGNEMIVPEDIPLHVTYVRDARDDVIPDRSGITSNGATPSTYDDDDDGMLTDAAKKLVDRRDQSAAVECGMQAAKLMQHNEWTIRELAQRLSGAESTIRKDVARWKEWEWIEKGALNGRYRFTNKIVEEGTRHG